LLPVISQLSNRLKNKWPRLGHSSKVARSTKREVIFRRSLSLRTKTTLGVALPLLLILGAFTALEYDRHRRTLLDNLSLLASHAGQVVELNLRHQMLESDFEGVQELLDELGARQEFRILYILAPSGEIIFSSHAGDQGRLLDNREAECQACHSLPPDERPASIVATIAEGERVFRSMQPIENSPACSRCHEPEDRILGLLLTDISIGPLEAPLTAHLRESIAWGVGALLVTIVIVNVALDRLVLRRLANLAANIARFGRGEFPTAPVSHDNDEVGQLLATFQTMAEKVAARSAENQTLSDSLRRQSAARGELLNRLITAQEDERKRIARELHDNLGQLLGGLALRLEAIERLADSDPRQARELLNQTQTLVTYGTNRMYDLILDLRPSSLDDLGLAAALRSHAQRAANGTGIHVEFDTSGLSGRLPPQIETILYRIFQEALNNVIRHADATHVSVALSRRNHSVIGRICDNGRGFDPAAVRVTPDNPRGLGLLGMQERLAQCGGRLEINSQPGKGAELAVYIPLAILGDPL
jgi:signal transduction histidine kinase